MRQTLRLFFKPRTFFNQLQWSQHHFLIFTAFLGITAFETYIGNSKHAYFAFAEWTAARFQIDMSYAIAMVTAGKLLSLIAVSYALAMIVWLVGSIFGHRSSQRVLFRRLCVVFTVALAAYTLSHFGAEFALVFWISSALALWTLVLAFTAIMEQFRFTKAQAVIVTLFMILLMNVGWHVGEHTVYSIFNIGTENPSSLISLAPKK